MDIIKIDRIFGLVLLACWIACPAIAQVNDMPVRKIRQEVLQGMDRGKIPGLSLVIVKDGQQSIENFGYSDLAGNKPVTSRTLFELGSCSKAFTALAVCRLVREGSIRLDADVSDYIPWFTATYKDSPVKITVLQALHHTSGIPWQTISSIPAGNEKDALEQTIRKINGITLHHLPGKQYEYATINYDMLALVIQRVTGQSFESYLQKNILDELGLSHTTVGTPVDPGEMSRGYKIGFFKPREYNAPRFRGNNAAGYVISDAVDIGNWLRFQMGLTNSDLFSLALQSHGRDETVPLHDMSSYAMGWEISLSGNREIYHGGQNPNFTSYIAFRPGTHLGIAVLANSNSAFTQVIGENIIKLLAGEKIEKDVSPGDGGDTGFSLVAFILAGYVLLVLAFFVRIGTGIARRKREFRSPPFSECRNFILSAVFLAPFLSGIYLLPRAIAGFNWESIGVWTPSSFGFMVTMALAAIGVTYLSYFASLFFPEKDPFKRMAPKILLMSVLSGISNMVVIILVTSALDKSMPLRYLVFYYLLTLFIYLSGRRFVQVHLIRFARGLIYELRLRIIEKIFSTSYQKFEKIDRGRIYTSLNDDVDMIGNSSNMLVMLVTSVITSAGAFVYLASIAFWATMITACMVVTLSLIYYSVSRRTNKYYDEARDTRNVFMSLVNGMIDGYKEISLHRKKKIAYKEDVAGTANEYREKVSIADITFVNAFLVGESLLLVLLGIVSFAIPRIFPEIRPYTIMSFVVVLLYLIGPINDILTSVPGVMQLRIAWGRIQQFLKEIPASTDMKTASAHPVAGVESIRAAGITFRYENTNERDAFTVGPIDLEVGRGEVLFIIGGNGSGKTTLAKLLTGLYSPDEGVMMINGKPVGNDQLSEYFSTVFSPAYLFQKLYNIDVQDKQDDVKKYLKLLHLDDKVEIAENRYSTINLSGGQRKRLALLQCYLEDSPIYLFDEWAADQDPDYRNFFYRILLPEMKRMGKIVIAITHDDHYFDMADKVMKMNQGKLELWSDAYAFADTATNP